MKSQRLAIFPLLYLAFLAVSAVSVWFQPDYDWDQIGYIGVINSLNHSPADAHRLTFDQLRREMPSKDYNEITRGAAVFPDHVNRYRATIASDPSSFAQQLAFYRFRIAYIGLLWLLHAVGLPIVRAARLIGTFAFLVYGLIVYLWLNRYFSRGHVLPLIWAVAVLLVSDSISVARTLTPDMLAASILLGGYYLLLEKRSIAGGTLLLLIAIATRTDYIIYAVLALLLVWRLGPTRRATIFCLAGGACALGLYLFLNFFFAHYPWSALIWHSFFEPLAQPTESHVTITAQRYAWLFAHGFDPLGVIRLVALIACTLAAILRPKSPDHASTAFTARYRAVAAVMFIGIAIHYLLFPGFWTRFFVANFSLALICVAITRFNALKRQSIPTLSPVPASSC